ncbi:MAG TPA: hypothetical protein VGQ45_15135 [Gaiellales bacterium]|jgi:hypothetical protein|nr:hypothetical protein [Gaiellales bacterium]
MKRYMIGLTAAAGLLLSGSATAQAQTPSLSTVLAHSHASNRALDRAVTEFDAHALGKGRVNLAASRRQMGLAVSQAAMLIKDANTPAERLAAARAVVVVAKQTSQNERVLAKVDRVLPKGKRLQRRVIHAAAVDTLRTQHAIDQLNELVGALPQHAQAGLSTALGRLVLSHGGAVRQLAADASSNRVGATAKSIAAADLAADVRGQHHAINLLQAIAPLLPVAAQDGIANALDAIATSLDRQAARMAEARTHAPARLHPAINRAIARAHKSANDARS